MARFIENIIGHNYNSRCFSCIDNSQTRLGDHRIPRGILRVSIKTFQRHYRVRNHIQVNKATFVLSAPGRSPGTAVSLLSLDANKRGSGTARRHSDAVTVIVCIDRLINSLRHFRIINSDQATTDVRRRLLSPTRRIKRSTRNVRERRRSQLLGRTSATS